MSWLEDTTKSKSEVDFIIEKDGEIIPIEVKINSLGKMERSLKTFIGAYKPKRAFVVSYKYKDEVKNFNDCKIFFTDILNLIKLLEE